MNVKQTKITETNYVNIVPFSLANHGVFPKKENIRPQLADSNLHVHHRRTAKSVQDSTVHS